MTARYLVDTDWAIHYLHGNQDIIRTLRRIASEGIALSMISVAELYEGVYYSRTPEDNERALGEFLSGIELIPVTEEIAKRFGKERGRLRAAKRMIGDFDLLIGTTALVHDLTLLTNNRRHFTHIRGVRLFAND
jgi:tRNA(fMet)-specific endonuclease VapC